MINNTDIFTRLDWLTNKVNRILGALQNGGGGGGGSQNINQVLATGATATDKVLTFNNTTGNNRTLVLSDQSLVLGNPDESYNTTINAGALSITGAYTIVVDPDHGITLQSSQPTMIIMEPGSFRFTNIIGNYPYDVGLSLDFNNNQYALGDISNSACLFIDAANDDYKLGNFSSEAKGLDINIGPSLSEYFLGNQDGVYFHINDADTGSFIVTSFPGGGESGLGLFNNTGEYILGDFGGTAKPNTYNVYLSVNSAKNNSSIITYYEGFNKGLYIDHQAGIYGFRNENSINGDAYFGLGSSTLTGFPSLAMSVGIALAGGSFTFNSYIPINRSGTMYYIPVYT
jgi:hypothetical protein